MVNKSPQANNALANAQWWAVSAGIFLENAAFKATKHSTVCYERENKKFRVLLFLVVRKLSEQAVKEEFISDHFERLSNPRLIHMKY